MDLNKSLLGLIFFCQAPTLATLLREGSLTESDLDEIVNTLSLHKELAQEIQANERKRSDPRKRATMKDIVDVKFLVVAKRLHKLFYDTYPGLKERCEREHEFLMQMVRDPSTGKKRPRGYVRSWGGPIRHLPEARFMRWDSRKKLVGADEKMWSKMFSGLKNQGGNTAIQTLEAYHTAPIVHCLFNFIRTNNLKSRVWNAVHDSIDLYVFKPELGLILSVLNLSLAAYDGSGHGIPMEMDANIANITGENRGTSKGKHFYHHGDEVHLKSYDFIEENTIGAEFVNTIPE
jgi:hypothetical protein